MVLEQIANLSVVQTASGFKSPSLRQVYSLIAQSVERRTVNPQVGGSNPPRGANIGEQYE
jgi:hypothetical protein